MRLSVIARSYVLALLVGALPFVAAAQSDVTGIIQKSVAANDRDWDADPEFDYYETDRDANGTKTYQVTTQYGTPYERLVAINGKELSDSATILSSVQEGAPFKALPRGESLQFDRLFGDQFKQPGVYRVSWMGAGFQSSEIVLRVLPELAR